MMKRLFQAVVICLLFFSGASLEEASAQSAQGILQQVNQFRANNGLPQLTFDGALAQAAQDQANYMAQNGVFSSHVGFGGSTPQSRAFAAGYGGRVSENIVGGTNLTAPRGLNWWVRSPVHYRTLITTRYTQAGTGYATDGEINYYVLVVGQPANSPVQPPVNASYSAPLIITPLTLSEPADDGSITHVVEEGQALWSMAAHYEVPLSDLLLYNSLAADAFVQPGDEIIIRLADGAPIPPTPAPPTSHTVRDGESLWTISALYDVKIGDVMLFNNMDEESFVRPGQEIKIRLRPGELPPPTPTPPLTHIVQPGQTLWEVALSYELTLAQILAFNDMAENDLLLAGDELWIRATPLPPATPLPIATMTPVPPTAAPTLTPTSISFPLTTPDPVAVANAANEEPPARSAVANAATTGGESSGLARPWLAGSILFGVGFLSLAVAFVIALRKEKI